MCVCISPQPSLSGLGRHSLRNASAGRAMVFLKSSWSAGEASGGQGELKWGWWTPEKETPEGNTLGAETLSPQAGGTT